MVKDNNRPLRSHKIMTSFSTLKKRTGTSSRPIFSSMEILEYTDYIANNSQFLTFNSIIQSV